MTKNIAVVVLNYIQFVNIKPGIDELIKKGYCVDLYCPIVESNDGFNDMFSDIRKYLKKSNYNIYSCVQDKYYQILLEPYPAMDIKSKYKIRYRYSNISAKPNIVYLPENYVKYDAILCSGNYDSNYLNVFSKTYITGNMKYINFRKEKCKEISKKILLYLPTYGDESSIDLIVNHIKDLKEKYYIIIKIHHGTSFLIKEKRRINKIKEYADEFYDCKKDLSELLKIADVVLTDNSGSIFEALYTYTPVAVFCDDINKNKKENFDTTQYLLYKDDILPYSNDINKIDYILEQACSEKVFSRQKNWSDKNFYHPKNQVKDFVDVIEKFMVDNIDKRNFEMHNILKNDYYRKINIINNLSYDNKRQQEYIKNLEYVNSELLANNNSLNENNNILKNELEDYRNGKLYKLATKIYKLIGALLWKRK